MEGGRLNEEQQEEEEEGRMPARLDGKALRSQSWASWGLCLRRILGMNERGRRKASRNGNEKGNCGVRGQYIYIEIHTYIHIREGYSWREDA